MLGIPFKFQIIGEFKMGFLQNLFEKKQSNNVSGNLVQLVFPFTMSQGGFTEVKKGYEDLIKSGKTMTMVDFFPLAIMVHESPNVFKPVASRVYRFNNDKDCWIVRPLAQTQVQFIFVVPGLPFDYIDEEGHKKKIANGLDIVCC
jgi:hypothetical protein